MIQWLDVKGRVIKNGTTSLLQLTKVKTEGNDLEYTCRVVGKFGNQSKTVILHVLPEEVPSSRVTGAASAAISVMAVLVLVTVVVIIIVRYIAYYNSNLHFALFTNTSLIRRKHRGKTMLFSERVKNKRFTTFMIHATPSHGGLDDKISTSAEEKDEETLEMKTFGKSYKGIMSCITVSES